MLLKQVNGNLIVTPNMFRQCQYSFDYYTDL